MKKLLIGTMAVALLLTIGCSKYEDKTYEIDNYNAGVLTLLDYPQYAITEAGSFFSDFLSIDSSMTVMNYDTILVSNTEARDSLVIKLEKDNNILEPSVNRRLYPVNESVVIALLDLSSVAVKDYILYIDRYMLIDFLDLNNNLEAVEQDNNMPLEVLALMVNVKERIQVSLGNSKYLVILKKTEASKGATNVGLVFTEADFDGTADICNIFAQNPISLAALTPGDLDTNWTGALINTAFLADPSVREIVADGFNSAQKNIKYFVSLSKDALDGYFLVNSNTLTSFYADKPVVFSLFALDTAGVAVPVKDMGVTMNEAAGCGLVSLYQFDLNMGTRYLVYALPAQGVTRFNLVVK
ncbi:MAG TPA: hypothetical protein ENN61_03925 [Bacteroidaceae bacterium]|nr:hypothetical protein [Bacteroidaceae bacterium]